MTTRVAINGFGRIGRDVLRAAFDRRDTAIEIVAVNDITSPETPAHLLAYDSTYGPWSKHVFGTAVLVSPRQVVTSRPGRDQGLRSQPAFPTRLGAEELPGR